MTTKGVTLSSRVAKTAKDAAVPLDELGRQTQFYLRTAGWAYKACLQYKKEVMRLTAEVGMGTGALGVIGGSIGVMIMLGVMTGGIVGTEGHYVLSDLSIGALNGVLSATFHTRAAMPLVTGFVLTVTTGAGAAAQLGAMRINEEIDALEVMAIRSFPYLVTTRVVAGLIVIIPIYSMGLITAYIANRLTVVTLYGGSGGVYDHYFFTFLISTDIFWSYVQAAAMVIVVMLISTYYGYTATGGPAGVGNAVGRAVRSSLVVVVTVDLLINIAVYGRVDTFQISG